MDSFLLLAVSGDSPQNLSIFDPVSPPAESIRTLSILGPGDQRVIFLIVEAYLFYSSSAFAGPHRPFDRAPAGVLQLAHRDRLDGRPCLIVFVLLLVTTRTLLEVNKHPPTPHSGDNTLFVTVVGRQWWWEYHYEYYNGEKLAFTTANELHVPAGEPDAPCPVRLTLKSADVCHSFWAPRLAGKTDLIPGRTNHMWFQTDKPGRTSGSAPSTAGPSTPACC